jgi:AraC-like DNA-binding protein
MPKVTEHAPYFSSKVVRTRRFFHPDWKKRQRDHSHLCLVGGGSEWCAPDFIVDRRHFPFVAFELVARGKGTLELSGTSYLLEAGHAYFFDSRQHHVIRSDTRDPLVKYFFNFSGTAIRTLLRELRVAPGIVLRVSALSRIVSLLEESIDHALKSTRLGYTAAVAAAAHALAVCAESRVTFQGNREAAHGTYLKCRDHLVKHYPELATINDAAHQCGVNAAYMTRLFKKFGHETPHDCLLRLKIAHAEQRLRQTGAIIKGVAAELGFKSAAHFSRVFKRLNGTAPVQFKSVGR